MWAASLELFIESNASDVLSGVGKESETVGVPGSEILSGKNRQIFSVTLSLKLS